MIATNDIVILVILGIFSLSGLITGFIKKTSGLLALAGGGVASFYLGGLISGALVNNIVPIREYVESNNAGGVLVLIGSYVGVFLIVYIIIRLIMRALKEVLNSNGLGKFIDKLLGIVAGACIGLVIADVYVWILYGLSCTSVDIATWVSEDARLSLDGFQTFTKCLMEFNLHSIGATFPPLS